MDITNAQEFFDKTTFTATKDGWVKVLLYASTTPSTQGESLCKLDGLTIFSCNKGTDSRATFPIKTGQQVIMTYGLIQAFIPLL